MASKKCESQTTWMEIKMICSKKPLNISKCFCSNYEHTDTMWKYMWNIWIKFSHETLYLVISSSSLRVYIFKLAKKYL